MKKIWLPTADDVQLRRVQLALGEGASARIFALNTAPVYGRIELEVTLAEGADFELFGANIGTGISTNEFVTNCQAPRRRRPLAPDRSARVLNGKAIGSYLGKVEVARGAQQTDAEQSIKAMLLDRGATANCKPELEIYADDVKCAHGATVGELDAMQLFYAESRGLDPASARALLLEGFVMGLWDSASDADAICEAARDALQEGGVNAPARINSALNVRDQFPAIAGWHYLDSAATAQKPQAVIDAITRGLCRATTPPFIAASTNARRT